MTLVVARIQSGCIAIVSDTQITDIGKQLPIQNGVLKTCMLYPGTLCVSFCNSFERAYGAVVDFTAKYIQGASVSEAIEFFEQSSVVTGNDYILAFNNPLKLVKIVDGKRIKTLAHTMWIGDKIAYERFREYEAKVRTLPLDGRAFGSVLFTDEQKGSPASDLYSVMRSVILDFDTPTVGGFAYVVSSRDNGFRQSVYCDMYCDWPKGEGEDYKLDLNVPLDIGATGENESYSIAQMSSGYVGLNAVAFYLTKPKKLFIFTGALLAPTGPCRVLNNIEPDQIKLVLDAVTGVDLGWTIFVSVQGQTSETQMGIRAPGMPHGIKFMLLPLVNVVPEKKQDLMLVYDPLGPSLQDIPDFSRF